VSIVAAVETDRIETWTDREPLIGGRWSWMPKLFRALVSGDHSLLVLGSGLVVRVVAAMVDPLVGLPQGAAGIVSAAVLALAMVALPVFGAVGEAREVSMITASAGRDAGTGYPTLPTRARLVVGSAALGIALGLIVPAILLDGEAVDAASAVVVGVLFLGVQLRLVGWQLGRWFGRG
jgi:hypothetical protein